MHLSEVCLLICLRSCNQVKKPVILNKEQGCGSEFGTDPQEKPDPVDEKNRKRTAKNSNLNLENCETRFDF